jgi:hypothetical protein
VTTPTSNPPKPPKPSKASGATPVPPGIAAPGRELWRTLTNVYQFDTRELIVLRLACRQADMVDGLEQALEAGGLIIAGSAGQDRLSPIPTELRQSRLALSRLLGDLSIPSEAGAGPTAASRRARKASASRWSGAGVERSPRIG